MVAPLPGAAVGAAAAEEAFLRTVAPLLTVAVATAPARLGSLDNEEMRSLTRSQSMVS
jgi:hypothetical protein